ncbi:MAG TPA: sulfotransferase domain-containing protein [Chloroflexota bacterium]|nr:sulfotransferase domain-containing protein [Chloroflexota bacterium]
MNGTKKESFITIVSGLPRSGTSMMMQMLTAGGIQALADGVRQADEDNPRGYYELERVKQIDTDTAWLDEAEGKAVKMVYRLLYNLPPNRTYRVIFMTRALDEVIASQEVMLERHGKESDRLDNARLATIYWHQLREIIAWLQAQPNFSVLSVDYHEVLRDPEQVVQQLNLFLDGRLNAAAMLAVPDWSLYRQRHTAVAVGPTIVA